LTFWEAAAEWFALLRSPQVLPGCDDGPSAADGSASSSIRFRPILFDGLDARVLNTALRLISNHLKDFAPEQVNVDPAVSKAIRAAWEDRKIIDFAINLHRAMQEVVSLLRHDHFEQGFKKHAVYAEMMQACGPESDTVIRPQWSPSKQSSGPPGAPLIAGAGAAAAVVMGETASASTLHKSGASATSSSPSRGNFVRFWYRPFNLEQFLTNHSYQHRRRLSSDPAELPRLISSLSTSSAAALSSSAQAPALSVSGSAVRDDTVAPMHAAGHRAPVTSQLRAPAVIADGHQLPRHPPPHVRVNSGLSRGAGSSDAADADVEDVSAFSTASSSDPSDSGAQLTQRAGRYTVRKPPVEDTMNPEDNTALEHPALHPSVSSESLVSVQSSANHTALLREINDLRNRVATGDHHIRDLQAQLDGAKRSSETDRKQVVHFQKLYDVIRQDCLALEVKLQAADRRACELEQTQAMTRKESEFVSTENTRVPRLLALLPNLRSSI